jgi:16S rRNA (cytosine967-C5)-methyltransferase
VLNRQARKLIVTDICLEDIFRQNPQLDHRDRAFIVHLVQGVLRWRRRLDWIIEQAADFPLKKITPTVLNILRLALYQIFFMDRVPESAAVNEAVNQAKKEGARYIVSFVNGILRNICRAKNDINFPDPDTNPVLFLCVFYSYPEWLVNKWLKEWGMEFTEALLAAGNQVPALTIRANRLKLNRSALIKRLAEEEIVGKPTSFSPDGVLIEDLKGRVDESISFKQGLFQVQDEAAQTTSYIVEPQAGQTILDVCAGLGGKSTHLAELMGDEGEVLALDISLRRLQSLVKNSKRLSITNIRPIVANASGPLSSLFRIKFDGIVIDAPCSGLGVLSRHPDGKWNKKEEDVQRLTFVQKSILNEAASLLKPGGKMLYVTCTISKQENEDIVHGCLSAHKELRLENIRDHIPAWGLNLIDDRGFLRTFPNEHDMDGFFGALFLKK